MGRYYSGDIEGKFWFAVQSSDDASFFGGRESEPSEINYDFDEDDMPDIKDGLIKCYEALGDYKARLDEFFKTHDSYNDKMLVDFLGFSEKDMDEHKFSHPKVKELLAWYARLELGEKIKKCVEETGYCSFTAEC